MHVVLPLSRYEHVVDGLLLRVHFDVVHVEHLRSAHFAPNGPAVPVVFDAVDCLTGLFSQMARSKRNPIGKFVMAEEAWKLRRFEPRFLRRFDRVVITSESERNALIGLEPALQVSVIPNGVDTAYFAPLGSDKARRRVVFSGKMSYYPNAQAALWFAENVFPALRNKWPDAEYLIVGSDPPVEVRNLGEKPGITVTGYVDDIRRYIDSSAVAVAPMQVAVGIQNKVLEAMAMAVPVVASPSGLRPFGSDCPGTIEAQSSEQVIERVSRLFERPDEAARIGQKGRAEVLARYSWQSSVEKLERIYEEAAACRCGVSGDR